MSTELQTSPLSVSFFDPRPDTAYTWLGMAGVAVNARGTVVLIDPLLTTFMQDGHLMSEAGERLKVALPIDARQIPQVDWILYTHADYDHIGQPTALTLASRLKCRFLAPAPVARILEEAGIPAGRIQVARDFMSLRAGEVEIQVSPALHDWQEENPWQREDCCGYLLRSPDGTIWHPGDTRLIPELLEVRGVDVFFFDVAAVDAHLGPSGSASLAASCGASTLIAYHYGTFDLPAGSYGGCDPQDALDYVKDLDARFLRPAPGEVFTLPEEH